MTTPHESSRPERRPGPNSQRPKRAAVAGATIGSTAHTTSSLDHSEKLARAMLHELAGLLDGSTRYLRLAQRTLSAGVEDAMNLAAVLNHLAAAESALLTMADLVTTSRSAFDPHDPTLGSISDLLGTQPVHQALAAAIEHLRPLGDERGVRIDLELGAGILECHPAPVYALATNVIRNAIEASPSGSNVIVRATAAESEGRGRVVTIEVTDEGRGIQDVDEQQIFELGYTSKNHGAGIGLALVRDLVRSLGGEVALLPNPNGRGALFRAMYPDRPPAEDVTIG
ncbi:MAG: HAMP domain-containing histidine kinase [Phycisphaerales bacterium]|nr:HAMP domain-containing histidine kinase [Phycisphaerales bacterium]